METQPTAVDIPGPPAPGTCSMFYRTPRAMLRGSVLDIVGYQEHSPGHFRQVERASLTVPFIVSLADPFAIALGRLPGAQDRQPSFAAGLYAGPVFIDSFGACECIQVNFTPEGARRFFGLPMHALADRMVPLDELFGSVARQLREHVGNERSWQTRFDVVENFIAARLTMDDRARTPAQWAYARLIETDGRERIGALAEEIGWSRRRLVERFRDEIGLPPKAIARIARFNRALRTAHTGDVGWAEIAADCGYADQAHLVRDFREFAGETPSGWAARLTAAAPLAA